MDIKNIHNSFSQKTLIANSDPPALSHNFMNIDDPTGTPTMSDKSTHFNMALRIKYR